MSRRRYGPANLLLELALVAAAAAFLFPLYVLVVISFKQRSEVRRSPLSLPTKLHLGNYETAWSSASLGHALFSSTFIAVSSVVIVIVLGSLASYAIARRNDRLGYGMYLLFLLGLVLPFQLALIPLYQLVRDLNLLGTYWAMIGLYAGTLLPFTIFLYTGFLRAMPRDYEEAALLDGATPLQAFAQIVFPLLRPITGTVFILNALTVWNDFLTPLLYLSGSGRETLPVAVSTFVGQYVSRWELVFAGLVIAIAPILAIYFLLQRYIIRGFASGLKG